MSEAPAATPRRSRNLGIGCSPAGHKMFGRHIREVLDSIEDTDTAHERLLDLIFEAVRNTVQLAGGRILFTDCDDRMILTIDMAPMPDHTENPAPEENPETQSTAVEA